MFIILFALVCCSLVAFGFGYIPPLTLSRLNESSGVEKEQAIPRRLPYCVWTLSIMLFIGGCDF